MPNKNKRRLHAEFVPSPNEHPPVSLQDIPPQVISALSIPSPTFDEIIDTLDNFTARFSFMINFDSKQKDFKPLLINLSLLTPFYVYLMKHYISYKLWIICVSVYFLIHYSTWCIALRRLLFRLKIVKQILSFLTNEIYSMTDNEIEVALLNLNTKNSIDQNTKIVEFQLMENERRWVGLGWCKKMLFLERLPFCTIDFKNSYNDLNEFQFPKLKNYSSSKWIWLDKNWIVDSNTNWTYYDNHWKHGQNFDSITKYTRSRNLKRQCLVVLNK
ncbi:hypothetical protein C6P40_002389 [Pichia californica]|uniref:Peroxin/Ferlin domain-containing protein n=1 Tax=Pichia californica TaxID=460514 RepID=A0A9P6WIH1_9ASCO|nr:hypothetical protein C6P42_002798 [[Candida] californica]KAG0687404.1 hypothetical protein C6P40_002389 [[Candida] californica]